MKYSLPILAVLLLLSPLAKADRLDQLFGREPISQNHVTGAPVADDASSLGNRSEDMTEKNETQSKGPTLRILLDLLSETPECLLSPFAVDQRHIDIKNA